MDLSSQKIHLVFKSRVVDSPKSKAKVRETACLIMQPNSEVPMAFAEVRQHVCDGDCKFIGQKRALEKCLKNFVPVRETRAQLWMQFLMRSAHGRKLIGVDGEVQNKN